MNVIDVDNHDDIINNDIHWGETEKEVEKYAKAILEELNATDYEKSKSAIEIYHKFREKYIGVDIPEATFRSTLSKLIKKNSSMITKQEGRHGYFLTTISASDIESQSTNNATVELIDVPHQPLNPIKISKREYLLYPLLEQWLSDQNYKVGKKIFHKKSHETWGNPDIAGIRVEEHLTRLEIEIATIEVKTSKDQWGCNWRKDIFEAVSHKRYANRVYFCFTVKFGDKITDLSDIKYYCEQYRIGLILIEINPTLFEKLDKWDFPNTGFTEEEKELIIITEKFPAPFDMVSLKYQREFCEKTLDITDMTSLFNYSSES